jgi:hypothetical protein
MKPAAVQTRPGRARRCLRTLERVTRRGRSTSRRSLRGPRSGRARAFERFDSGCFQSVDEAAHPHGEGGANLCGARRELRENTAECLLRNSHHDRVLGRPRADAAFGRRVECALADEGASGDAPFGLRLRSVFEQRDRARMDEIPGIGGFAGKNRASPALKRRFSHENAINCTASRGRRSKGRVRPSRATSSSSVTRAVPRPPRSPPACTRRLP